MKKVGNIEAEYYPCILRENLVNFLKFHLAHLALCALMLVLLGRERPTAQAAAINLVAGIVLALMAGWCTWTIHAEDPRSEFPLWALFLYCSSGVIPFAMLRHNARKWVRVVAFVVMSVLGAVALLILLPAALAKLH